MFTSAPLTSVGNATVKANNITYAVLLTKILENTKFSYKKINNIYYFGAEEQSSLLGAVVVPLLHRSIEIMSAPIQSNTGGVNSNQSVGNSNTGYNNSNQNILDFLP